MDCWELIWAAWAFTHFVNNYHFIKIGHLQHPTELRLWEILEWPQLGRGHHKSEHRNFGLFWRSCSRSKIWVSSHRSSNSDYKSNVCEFGGIINLEISKLRYICNCFHRSINVGLIWYFKFERLESIRLLQLSLKAITWRSVFGK